MSLTAERNEQFSEQAYWEQRYQDDSEPDFDWFKTYQDLEPILTSTIGAKTSRILMLGCGNSTLSGDMYSAGYEQIVNIDYSRTCIARQSLRYPRQTWHVVDITQLTASQDTVDQLGGLGSFDIGLDKGTLDALIAQPRGSDPWNLPSNLEEKVDMYLRGTYQLLKPAGKFVYITFGQPHFRLNLLSKLDWIVETQSLGDMFHYYVYICTKPSGPQDGGSMID
ncbi:hypothetical protein BCV70DRAFT_126172 [Testicularia cyperi]|uniref:Uncharacterized protein n=1 Tax=Testicularia cyperi TaxID=1882483 RepID=A0A317XLL4_9BASI|nr:hypothetical protein BCV70DRAFT_126172 [Testicularia cyperi]